MRTPTICILLLLIALVLHVQASEPTVTIAGYRVVPEVLVPGEEGLVTISLISTSESAMETKTSTYGTYPSETISETRHLNPYVQSVYLSGGEIDVLGGNAQFEGEIGPNQVVNLTFQIRAPEKAGIYFPVLRVRVRGAESLIYPLPVNVNMPVFRLRAPAIVLEKDAIPTIRPGEGCELRVVARNSGEGLAQEVSIRITDEDPAIAVSSPMYYHIALLEPGQASGMEVRLLSDRTSGEGIHELPISLDYHLADGSRISREESIAVNIRGEARLAIRSVETDPEQVREGDRFDLVIRLENTGTGKARSIRASTDLPLQGVKEAYIGTIKAGNDAPAVFLLRADRAGDLVYTLSLAYEDDWGMKREEHTLVLHVERSSGVQTLLLAILLIAAGAIAGWYLWKKGRTEG